MKLRLTLARAGNQSGGYTKSQKTEYYKKVSIIVKTIAAFFNALIIIIIAIWGVLIQDKSNQLEKDNTVLVFKNDSLSKFTKIINDKDTIKLQK